MRDLTHDGSWNTFDANVLKLSKVSFRGVIRTLQSNLNIYSPPSLQLPLIMEDLPAYPQLSGTGHPLKLPSSEKLASQVGRLAGPVFYVNIFSLGVPILKNLLSKPLLRI